MPSASPESQQPIKIFLRQAAPLIRSCNEALVKRDLAGLQHYAKEFQNAARSSGQVMLEVQAQLLTQAAEQREMYQVSYLLTRISKTLSTMLADAREQVTQQAKAKAQAPKSSPTDSDSAKRLGNYLIEAELLTPAQIEVALADQKVTGARLGEILATRGWIKQGTIEYIMRKVIMPDRKTAPLPPASVSESTPTKPASQPPTAKPPMPTSESINAKATLVDEHKSTYLLY